MASSLVRWAGVGQAHGKKLHWGRISQDGLPFLGDRIPMVPNEEYEERVVRVARPQNGFFDVLNKSDNKLFLEVVDCICNGWFQLIHIERFWRNTTQHYLEWVEFYMEDGSRTPFANMHVMEGGGGQQSMLANNPFGQ